MTTKLNEILAYLAETLEDLLDIISKDSSIMKLKSRLMVYSGNLGSRFFNLLYGIYQNRKTIGAPFIQVWAMFIN